jgi:uncharacterized membrane protein YkoI
VKTNGIEGMVSEGIFSNPCKALSYTETKRIASDQFHYQGDPMSQLTSRAASTPLLKAITVMSLVAFVGMVPLLASAASGANDVVGHLKESKHTLAEGIAQSEKENGIAISAKFEMDGDTLMLSVYTAKAGAEKDAEHNVLIELAGKAAQPAWSPAIEVFEDKEHLKRSAMQLTLVQVSGLTLSDALKKAQKMQPGTAYSIIPMVKQGAPVFDVAIAAPDGKVVHVSVDRK